MNDRNPGLFEAIQNMKNQSVVEPTHLNNITQIEAFSQVGVKYK